MTLIPRQPLLGRLRAAPADGRVRPDGRERAKLRDGREVLISPLTPSDAPLLADAFERLSAESRRLRFLGPKTTLSASEINYLTHVDGHHHEALSAVDAATGQGAAIARFVRDLDSPERAEVAITVVDDWQGRGLGRLMLDRLVDRARQEQIRRFTALVSTDNHAMQALLGRLDGRARVRLLGNGVSEWEIELPPKGLGRQLEEALRAAAAGQLQLPPAMCEALRGLLPDRSARLAPGAGNTVRDLHRALLRRAV